MTDTTTNQGAAAEALAGGSNDQTAGSTQPTGGTPAPTEKYWYSDLDPVLQGKLESKGWNNPTALPKALEGYFEMEKQYRSGDKVMLPKDENDVEGRNTLYNRLGRPDKVEGYKFPDGVDMEYVKTIAPKLHEGGFTQKQVELAAQIDIERQKNNVEMERQRVVNEQNLADQYAKQKWGSDYPKNMEFARRAMRGVGMDVDTQFAALTASLGGKMAIDLLYMAGHAVKESDAAFIGDNNNPSFGMSKNRAQAEIKSDAGRALYQRARDGDKTALARWKTLNQQANPDGVIEM